LFEQPIHGQEAIDANPSSKPNKDAHSQ
jgi:hypothetical protein